jgi:hypothetical protein
MRPLVLPMIAFLASLAADGWGDASVPLSPATAEKSEQLFAAGAFEDPQICAGCHDEIHQAWSNSMHAHAWENKWYRMDYQLAHEETDGATDMLCGACHAPIAARTGQLPPHDGSRFDEISMQGVSCDFCHTVSGMERLYNMGHVSSPGPLKRGPRGDGESPYHEVRYSELHTRAEFCGSCHNARNPATGLYLINTYEDWQSNDYGRQGIRCQDCHMTPTPGIGKNPGRSASMGPEREQVAFHGFIGGSSYAQSYLGHQEQAQMSREFLQAAAVVELAEQVTDDGTLMLTVDVRNVGAGHKIPTGVTYIRKMWLHVEVMDDKGKIVYSSGHINENNHVDPDAVFFRLLFVDEKGELTEKSWRARSIGYDRRIAANGSEREVYRIGLPARGEYTVNARLMYRSFSQATMDRFHQTAGEPLPPVESVEMARETAAVRY